MSAVGVALGLGVAVIAFLVSRSLVARGFGQWTPLKVSAERWFERSGGLRAAHILVGPLAVWLGATGLYAAYRFTTPDTIEGAPGQVMVTPGTAAERAGIKDGDVIVAVDGDPVASYEDALTKLAFLRHDPRVRERPIRVRREAGTEELEYGFDGGDLGIEAYSTKRAYSFGESVVWALPAPLKAMVLPLHTIFGLPLFLGSNFIQVPGPPVPEHLFYAGGTASLLAPLLLLLAVLLKPGRRK